MKNIIYINYLFPLVLDLRLPPDWLVLINELPNTYIRNNINNNDKTLPINPVIRLV